MIFDGHPDNLHWFWDTGLLELINRNEQGLAAELTRQIAAEPVIELQLEKAGVRLAYLLSTALK